MSRLGVVQGLGDVVGEDLGEESSQDSEEESGKKLLCEREGESLFYVSFCTLQLMAQANLQLLRTSLTLKN